MENVTVDKSVSVVLAQKEEWNEQIRLGQKKLQELTEESNKVQHQLFALAGAVQACDVLLDKFSERSSSVVE